MIERIAALIATTTPGPWLEDGRIDVTDEFGKVLIAATDTDALGDAAFIAHARQLLPLMLEVVKGLAEFDGRLDHSWRCEYRTAKEGWHEGDPPVVICECGYDDLDKHVKALDAYCAEHLPADPQEPPSES